MAAGMALALLAGCSPPSGIEPPPLLTVGEIAALDSLYLASAAPDEDDIEARARRLAAASTHADFADSRARGDALRARAAGLRAREAAQLSESDRLRQRAEALRQSSAEAAREEAVTEEAEAETGEERRLRD